MNTVIDIKKMQFTQDGRAVKITLSFNGEPDQQCTAQVENLEISTIKKIIDSTTPPPIRPTCVIREEGCSF